MKKTLIKPFYFGFVLFAWVSYIWLTAAAPKTSSSVHLSKLVIVSLSATLFIPYLLTWLIAALGLYHFGQFYSVARQKRLANSIAFGLIMWGLSFLILDLITSPFFSAFRNFWQSNHRVVINLTIISNYAHITFTLVAFVFLYLGTRLLARSSHYATSVRSKPLPALVATVLFTLLFSIAVFSNPTRQTSLQSGQFATYYLTDLLILLTIIAPLAITWFLGLQAALNTEQYVHSLSHPMWRLAIVRFFHGLLAVLSSAIILQGITMLGSQQLQNINLVLILVIVYLFIIIQAIGYLFIKASAKQLRKLAEVGVGP
ncbi:MAG TPA: hypothetical protein VLF79_04395 [Candidatus Saccharimonadales bacterium]|nr:hypothetical protein [Candidatus Saccharimonadales bacterium]